MTTTATPAIVYTTALFSDAQVVILSQADEGGVDDAKSGTLRPGRIVVGADIRGNKFTIRTKENVAWEKRLGEQLDEESWMRCRRMAINSSIFFRSSMTD